MVQFFNTKVEKKIEKNGKKKMKIEGQSYKTIWFENNLVKIIDQTKLPHRFVIKDLKTVKDSINAIKTMEVRGAPLIGATAAYGLVLSIIEDNDLSFLKKSSEELIASRPTAINLKWAVERMMKKLTGINEKDILKVALEEAKAIKDEDEEFCKKIGLNGLQIIEEISNKKKDTVNILTHCNAGWLATIDWGTATSPIYHAHQKGIKVHVWVDETRPRNQGANLTSYELNEEGIPNTIIADNTGGILMQRGKIDMCIVGTDRTLSNGDVCNKIGTYLKALAAKDNNIPFYVALPSSTIDWNIKDHKEIPIEERNSEELSHIEGLDKDNNLQKVLIYPQKSKTMNLAFDVTPAKYVTGLITEKGVCEASEQGLKSLFK
jgi:methylthioribose-1-phosphate isomerase